MFSHTNNTQKATADLQARRQQLLREKLERRQHDRKMAKEHKKRAAIIRLLAAHYVYMCMYMYKVHIVSSMKTV